MLASYKSYWANYINFSGVSSRYEFWIGYFIPTLIVEFILGVVSLLALGVRGIFIMLLLFGLANIIPGLAIAVRRLRDAGFSPFLFLVSFIPFVGSIILLVLLLMPTAQSTRINTY